MIVVVLLLVSSAASAQSPAAPAAPAPQQQTQQEEQPQLPDVLRLERDNLLLQVRIAELELQLSAAKAQLLNARATEIAPSLIQRLQTAAPDFDVDPQTLQLTRKKSAAGAAPAAAPPAAPGSPPASPTPQQR
jgi:hypothetical protein